MRKLPLSSKESFLCYREEEGIKKNGLLVNPKKNIYIKNGKRNQPATEVTKRKENTQPYKGLF